MTFPSRVAWLIATCGGVGQAPKAPGTLGSLAAFPLAAALLGLFHTCWMPWVMAQEGWPHAQAAIAYWSGIMGVLIAAGWWASSRYIARNGAQDPQEIVIDEVAGQLLVFLAAYGHMFRAWMAQWPAVAAVAILSFVLFRLFDIAKPWPVCMIDRRVKGGLGVMLDDLAAALYAILVLAALRPYVERLLDAVS